MHFKESELEIWLRKNNMRTVDFLKKIGCSRPTLWKVKRGIAICPLYAKKIYEETNGEVKPLMNRIGRQ